MNHSTNVFSPPGTPLLDRTVGELVAERPGRSRVFDSLGIDFCCQGGRTLRDACGRKGIAPSLVVDRLDAESAAREPATNPAGLAPRELAAHIVATHHAYLRAELPRILAMSERVAGVHGGHTPALVEMLSVFRAMASELEDHLRKEEEILFPAIVRMSLGGAAPIPIDAPLACMLREHEDAGGAMARLRELSDGFEVPSGACNTYRALFAALRELEEDLHRHIHLENSVLFPTARALAERASALAGV